MSSNLREFFTADDLSMLDRVLAHADLPRSDDATKHAARLDASRFLIARFQRGVTTELGLRSDLADRRVIEAPKVGAASQAGRMRVGFSPTLPVAPGIYPGGGYQYGKRVEATGKWTVYHVFTGVPAQFGAWEMVNLDAKTAERALGILNTPERPDGTPLAESAT